MRVSDRDAFRMARRITREEGILVGSSSGTAVVAALTIASELAAGTTVVVILPDTGRNYLSKAYSDTWLLQYGLMERRSCAWRRSCRPSTATSRRSSP